MTDRTQRFIDALHTLEDGEDVQPIADLFAEGADVSNPMVKHPGEGEQGAADFWTMYRRSFDTVHSEFRNIVDQGEAALLEWTSTGSIKGQDFTYGGVSVLEFGEGEKLTAFRTYFDPTPLARVMKETAKG